MDFTGKVALVTGGTRGIGEATADALADLGASVCVTARNKPHNWPVQDRIHFFATDICDPAQVESLVRRVSDKYGRLDCAVNCAGYEGDFHCIDQYPDEDCRQVLNVNVLGTFWAMKYQIRAMRQHYGGAIVNMSSIAGLKGIPLASPYVASKHAVIGLTRSAALDVVQDGIRVNALCPSLVDTTMADRLSDKSGLSKANLVSASPMKRIANPNEIAAAILWLLSEQASFVTGQAISVDGGQSIA